MNILSLQSSIGGAASVTRTLTGAYIARLQTIHCAATVVEHDLLAEAFPHLSSDMVAVSFGMPHGPSAAAQLSDQLIAELEQCDVLLLGTPMYNFGIPSTLKAWFDYVIRAGRTFQYVDGARRVCCRPGKRPSCSSPVAACTRLNRGSMSIF